ncbi:MAG: hypothetical protein ACRCZ9_11480 [Fusobacteriaceae bacterium]
MGTKVVFLFSENFSEQDSYLIKYISKEFPDFEPLILNDAKQSEWLLKSDFEVFHKLTPIKGEPYWNTAHRLLRSSNGSALMFVGWKDVVVPKKSVRLQENIIQNECLYGYRVSTILGDTKIEKII